MKDLRYRAEYFVFRLTICIVQAMTARQTAAASETLAFLFHAVLPRKLTRYNIARENLRRAFGDDLQDAKADRIIYGMWVHLFRLIGEIIQLPRKLRLSNCGDIMDFRNRNESVQALCTGRPVINLGGHYGNWEMAMTVFGHFGFPLGVVARDLDNPYLHEWFLRFRRHTGHVLISKKGGGDQMVDFLEKNGHLALLADQDAGRKGVFVDFFGHPASTFKSIALIAIQYRAVICVGYTIRLNGEYSENDWARFEMGCEDVIDTLDYDGADAVEKITQRYTKALERAVRRAPEQYFWVHRRWKTAPKQRRKRKAVA